MNDRTKKSARPSANLDALTVFRQRCPCCLRGYIVPRSMDGKFLTCNGDGCGARFGIAAPPLPTRPSP